MSLKEFRKERNLTQEQLADALSVSRITIVRLEADGSNVKGEFIRRLTEVFDLPLNVAWNMFYGSVNGGGEHEGNEEEKSTASR